MLKTFPESALVFAKTALEKEEMDRRRPLQPERVGLVGECPLDGRPPLEIGLQARLALRSGTPGMAMD